MFKRKEVNFQELKTSSKLVIIPQKVQYDDQSKEIWLFGLTPDNQTVLIRIKNVHSLFYVANKKYHFLDQVEMISDLSDIFQKEFKGSKVNISVNEKNKQINLKIEIENIGDDQSQLEKKLKNVKEKYVELFKDLDIFVPKMRDQFIIFNKINSKSFIEIDFNENNILLDEENECDKNSTNTKISKCQIEILSSKFEPKLSYNQKLYSKISSNQVILITDIENLIIENGFEIQKVKKNPIFMISNLIFKNGGTECMKQIFTTSKKMELDSEVEVKYFEDEYSLLASWSQELDELDPDVISGFNVLKYDLCFIRIRFQFLIEQKKQNSQIINFGRIPHQNLSSKIIEELFTNKFYFYLKEDIQILEPAGRLVIDSSWYFNQTQSYIPPTERKLKDWAIRYLDDNSHKLDIPYDKFNDYLYSEDIEKRSLLGKYNIRDSEIVQELFLKFDILDHYSDQGYLNDTLSQIYHDKNFFPLYWNKLNEFSFIQKSIDYKNECLLISDNKEESWNKIQQYLQHLTRVNKVEFDISSNTSALIFKQIIKFQDNLKLENISFKINESISDISFKLNSLIQNLSSTQTKNLSISTNSQIMNLQLDFIESLSCLPPSLQFIFLQIHSSTEIMSNPKKSVQDYLKEVKAIKLEKIALDFDNFQENQSYLIEYLSKFIQYQKNLKSIDLIFQYDSTNDQFISNTVKSIISNSKQLQLLRLTIKGNGQLKENANEKQQIASAQLLLELLRIQQKELLCINRIYFTFQDITIHSFNDDIFSQFANKLTTLQSYSFTIDNYKRFLKTNFYNMIKTLKERQ